MWIVPLLAKSGAVAVCEAYLSAVMDLCVEGEPGTNSHKCVAQNAAAGCSTAWGKVPAFLKFSEQSLEISRRGLQLVGEEAKKHGATVCCLSETAAFWPREQYKKPARSLARRRRAPEMLKNEPAGGSRARGSRLATTAPAPKPSRGTL
eukprot:COSAG06_NODE_1605_length_8948_cov_25.421939_1_plen_149_part_00